MNNLGNVEIGKVDLNDVVIHKYQGRLEYSYYSDFHGKIVENSCPWVITHIESNNGDEYQVVLKFFCTDEFMSWDSEYCDDGYETVWKEMRDTEIGEYLIDLVKQQELNL